MPKINLSEGKTVNYIRQAGEKVLLKITKAAYDQDFGRVEITLENAKGESINNNYGLLSADGSTNDGALKAFSYFARVAVGDWGRDDIEDEEMVGRFIRADIVMVEGKKESKDGRKLSFANISKTYMTQDSFSKTSTSNDEDEGWE